MEKKLLDMLPKDWNVMVINGNKRTNYATRNGVRKLVEKHGFPKDDTRRSTPLIVLLYFSNGRISELKSTRRRKTKKVLKNASLVDNQQHQQNLLSSSSNKQTPVLPVDSGSRCSKQWLSNDYNLRSSFSSKQELLAAHIPFPTQCLNSSSSPSFNEDEKVLNVANLSPELCSKLISINDRRLSSSSIQDVSHTKDVLNIAKPLQHTTVQNTYDYDQPSPTYCGVVTNFAKLNIDTPILTDLTATTTSVRHDENVSIQDENEYDIQIQDEDINMNEPEYISNMRKENMAILKRYDQEILAIRIEFDRLKKRMEATIDEKEKIRKMLEEKLTKEIFKWKKKSSGSSNKRKLKRISRKK